MSSSAPPPPSNGQGISPPPRARLQRKRPWYLVVALFGAWVFGAAGMVEGCAQLSYYRGERAIDAARSGEGIPNEAERAKVIALFEAYYATLDAARPRVLPLEIAALLLGVALSVLAAGAVTGRRGSRSALLQLTVVQAGLAILSYALTPDVRRAQMDALQRQQLATRYDAEAGSGTIEAEVTLTRPIWQNAPTVGLSLHTFASVLIVLALTRKRAREWLEATPIEP
jgi:hypothetical protein